MGGATRRVEEKISQAYATKSWILGHQSQSTNHELKLVYFSSRLHILGFFSSSLVYSRTVLRCCYTIVHYPYLLLPNYPNRDTEKIITYLVQTTESGSLFTNLCFFFFAFNFLVSVAIHYPYLFFFIYSLNNSLLDSDKLETLLNRSLSLGATTLVL